MQLTQQSARERESVLHPADAVIHRGDVIGRFHHVVISRRRAGLIQFEEKEV
jgi:hypothetical protein